MVGHHAVGEEGAAVELVRSCERRADGNGRWWMSEVSLRAFERGDSQEPSLAVLGIGGETKPDALAFPKPGRRLVMSHGQDSVARIGISCREKAATEGRHYVQPAVLLALSGLYAARSRW